jgi:Tol biopolymer transport system component
VKEERARERLRELRAPDERKAEERSWRVVRAAFEEVRLAGSRPRRARLALALASAAALVAVAFSPPGDAIGDWLHDAITPGRKPAKGALVSLPAPGRLLVTSSQGPWVVQQDGSKRLLGGYDSASWSPLGLFVVAPRGRQLIALEPGGRVHWSLARRRPVVGARWSPDGFRIVYRSSNSLRLVNGDGTGDRILARSVAPTAPAWRPGRGHVLAATDWAGRVFALDADSGKLIWRSSAAPIPTQLSWSADGRRVIALAPASVRLFDARGRSVATLSMPLGTRAETAAFAPGGHEFALVRHVRAARRSEVELVRARVVGRWLERRLFAGVGRFAGLTWSPDGRWLLVGWRDADQWLFIRASTARRVAEKIIAVSNISRQFNPGARAQPAFPDVSGWCCAP